LIADLTVITGPMFAGKTSELIRRVREVVDLGEFTAVIVKPAMDSRFDQEAIVSHDGVAWRAIPVSEPGRIVDLVARAVGAADRPLHVFADEVQFLESPHFDGSFHLLVHALLREGHAVTCAGLDVDWRGMPFDVTARLLAMADHVVKLRARCTVSGAAASKTFRKHAGGPRIILGAADMYEARANAHWHVGAQDTVLPPALALRVIRRTQK
jgi:thymidine kinase